MALEELVLELLHDRRADARVALPVHAVQRIPRPVVAQREELQSLAAAAARASCVRPNAGPRQLEGGHRPHLGPAQQLAGERHGQHGVAEAERIGLVHEVVEPAALLDCGPFGSRARRPEVERWLGQAARLAENSHDHRHGFARDWGHGPDGHGPDPTAGGHDRAIRTFCIRRAEPLSAAAASLFLSLLLALAGPRLLRVKGILGIREEPDRPLVVHAVQHVVHEPVELDRWPSADHSTRLVFVTRDLPRAAIEELWDSVQAHADAGFGEAAELTV